MNIGRRAFLTGLTSLIAAPAIVRAESLMKVRGVGLWLPQYSVDGMHMNFGVSGIHAHRLAINEWCRHHMVEFHIYDSEYTKPTAAQLRESLEKYMRALARTA